MGEFKAGTMLIGLSAYFIFLILFLSMTESISASYGLDYSITTTGNTSLLDGLDTSFDGSAVCQEPRSWLPVENGDYIILNDYDSQRLDCKFTQGQVDLDICPTINGCSVINDTFFFGLFQTGTQVCDGIINLTGINISDYDVSGNDRFISVAPAFSRYHTLCSVVGEENFCSAIGCSWTTLEEDSSQGVSTTSMLEIVGALFTFQATFTDIFILNLLLTIVLFYLPLFAFAVAIYFMIPVIH